MADGKRQCTHGPGGPPPGHPPLARDIVSDFFALFLESRFFYSHFGIYARFHTVARAIFLVQHSHRSVCISTFIPTHRLRARTHTRVLFFIILLIVGAFIWTYETVVNLVRTASLPLASQPFPTQSFRVHFRPIRLTFTHDARALTVCRDKNVKRLFECKK